MRIDTEPFNGFPHYDTKKVVVTACLEYIDQSPLSVVGDMHGSFKS